MPDGKYSIRYLPGFEEDLSEIADYISFKLHNPVSALNLLRRIETAILERLDCPEAFESFPSNRKRKNPYFRIYVDNFTVYYVVIDKVMEIRRVIYSRKDAAKIIK